MGLGIGFGLFRVGHAHRFDHVGKGNREATGNRRRKEGKKMVRNQIYGSTVTKEARVPDRMDVAN
jgi:hypothetical protein